VRPYLDGTAQHPDTAEVDVARGLDVAQVEVAEGGEGVVVRVVVVPGEAGGVYEIVDAARVS
jgi:hypothetical protein